MATSIRCLRRWPWAGSRPNSLLLLVLQDSASITKTSVGSRLFSMATNQSGLAGLISDNTAINGHGSIADTATSAGPTGEGKRRKLHGRVFYESIGSPKFVLAPMVDQSEFVSCRFGGSTLRLLIALLGMASTHSFIHASIPSYSTPSLYTYATCSSLQRNS